MDFELVFGSLSDASKLECVNIHQNDEITNILNTLEGESYFDLCTKIDLKT